MTTLRYVHQEGPYYTLEKDGADAAIRLAFGADIDAVGVDPFEGYLLLSFVREMAYQQQLTDLLTRAAHAMDRLHPVVAAYAVVIDKNWEELVGGELPEEEGGT